MRRTIAAALGAAALAGAAPACVIQTGQADKFREPLPQASDAALAFAGSTTAGTRPQAAAATSLHVQSGSGGGSGAGTQAGYASYYEFTRGITDAVDTVTVAIVGEIVVVASLPPTTVDANHAVWGPGSGDALDPVSWKLTVTLVGGDEFDYEVDGRPHLSQSEADWKAILTGHGFGKSSASYRSGSFVIDQDALRALDPTRTTSTGTVAITYDARSYPLNALADVTPNDGTGASYHVTVLHGQDGSGIMTLNAATDVSTPPDGTNESVAENSRWDSTGAGRADVKLSGGDLGAATVMASQCWSDAFAQVYYTDSVGYEPTSGSAASCAYAQAQFTSN
jgi:hypothetical protein